MTACRATVAALLEFAVDYNSDRLPFAQPEDWPEATIAMCPNLVRRRSVPERWVRLAPPLALGQGAESTARRRISGEELFSWFHCIGIDIDAAGSLPAEPPPPIDRAACRSAAAR